MQHPYKVGYHCPMLQAGCWDWLDSKSLIGLKYELVKFEHKQLQITYTCQTQQHAVRRKGYIGYIPYMEVQMCRKLKILWLRSQMSLICALHILVFMDLYSSIHLFHFLSSKGLRILFAPGIVSISTYIPTV